VTIDEQLREIARHADEHQQAITLTEIVQRAAGQDLTLSAARSPAHAWRAVAVAAATAVVVAAGVTVTRNHDPGVTTTVTQPAPAGRTTTSHGYFAIIDPTTTGSLLTPCSGEGLYDDIDSSTTVELRNRDGDVVAETTLGQGETVEPGECGFKFALDDVSLDAGGYVVAVGDHGETSYTPDELKREGIMLVVGEPHPGAHLLE
jgi:hypothetical protein